MDNQEQRLREVEFHLASLHAHRIAVDTFLRTIAIDIYATIEGGAERFTAIMESEINALHALQPTPLGPADAEFVKNQAIHALEGLCGGIPNFIREQRGEPLQRPN